MPPAPNRVTMASLKQLTNREYTTEQLDQIEEIVGWLQIDGLKDYSTELPAIKAEVAYGPRGAPPAEWPDWQDMAFDQDRSVRQRCYVVKGKLRPKEADTYPCVMRYTADGGKTWHFVNNGGVCDGDVPLPDDEEIVTMIVIRDATNGGSIGGGGDGATGTSRPLVIEEIARQFRELREAARDKSLTDKQRKAIGEILDSWETRARDAEAESGDPLDLARRLKREWNDFREELSAAVG